MIIIKTKQGDIMVREGAVESITHNRETRTVTIKWTKPMGVGTTFAEPIIEHVVCVVYINDQTGNEWADKGLQVQELQKRLSEQLTEMGWLRHWAHSLDSATSEFVGHIQSVMAMNQAEISEALYDQIDGFIKKAYDATSSHIYEHGDESIYEQWKEKHLANSWAEADITAQLHDTIEEQAATIRELKTANERLEANERMRQATTKPTYPGDLIPPPRCPWWRRWLNI